MEFRVGDKVKCIKSAYDIKEGQILEVSNLEDIENDQKSNTGHNDATIYLTGKDRYDNSFEGKHVYERYFEFVSRNENFIKQTKMEKKIYEVLTANKKTGKTKKEIVVADSEQSAILKAFGVDADNTFIKVTEEGKYEEEKPVQAVIVKEEKK